jgi:hypothetical protein
MTNFRVKSTIILHFLAKFFFTYFKIIIHNFMIFVVTKNGRTKKIFPSSFSAVVGSGIQDPGSGMDINQDPG